jgi:hypothetical protein
VHPLGQEGTGGLPPLSKTPGLCASGNCFAGPGATENPGGELGEMLITGHSEPSPSLPAVPRLELTLPTLTPASGYGGPWYSPSPPSALASGQCYNGCIDRLGANYAMDVLLATTPFAPTLKTPAELAKTLGGGSPLTTWASRASARLGMRGANWLRSGGRVAGVVVAVPFAFSLGYFATSTALCTIECH